jgi:two-component sensor histidine kinase
MQGNQMKTLAERFDPRSKPAPAASALKFRRAREVARKDRFLQAFAKTDWWQRLDEAEQRAFEGICSKPIAIAAKSDIDPGGKASPKLYLVLDGWFARYRETGLGLRQTLSISLAGECLNPEALYLDSSTIGLSALTDGSVVAIEKADLQALAAERPNIARTFQHFLAAENMVLSEETARLGRRTARERLAHFMCEMVTRLDRVRPADHRGHHFPLTQDQVADALGLTVVHVNRTLQDLRAMNLVEWRAHRLLILDWNKLADIASFDPAYLEPSPDHDGSHHQENRVPGTQFRELQHRFKNLIAVVGSITRQTLTDDADMGDARQALTARLDALGKSIDVLATGDWESGSLLETVRQTLQLSGADGRIRFDGPDLMLEGRVISTLAMALHELLTNAVKYGSLSVPSGEVKLFWKAVQSDTGPKLWMQWSEKGGPRVEHKPEPGFGTQLLTTVTAQNLSGETILDHDRDGVNWLLIAPLEKIAPAGESQSLDSGEPVGA